jgi:uncharacterized cupredoxin-like copper-binding protein
MRHAHVFLVGVVLAAAGCGGSSSGKSSPRTESSTAAAAAGRTVTIHETEFRLEPATVDLRAPGPVVVRAVNDGKVTHALGIEGHGVDAETAEIDPGESTTLRVDLSERGTYELYCPVDGHKQQGMEGKLAIGGGGAGTGTTEEKGKSGTTGGYGYSH